MTGQNNYLDYLSDKYESDTYSENAIDYHSSKTKGRIVGDRYDFPMHFHQVRLMGLKEKAIDRIEKILLRAKGLNNSVLNEEAKIKANLYLFHSYLDLSYKSYRFAREHWASWFGSEGIVWEGSGPFSNGLQEAHYKLGEESKSRANKVRKTFKREKDVKESYRLEALLFERYNENKLKEVMSENWQDAEWNSPKNRSELKNIAELWAYAGEYEKAEKYFERAGPWEWVSAIHAFEKTKQKDKAKKFYLLRAEHPTGYFEDMDRVRAGCYEVAGELEKAIEFYERSAAGFRMQEGSYDLHGDLKPGIEAAESDEKDAQRLRKKLEKIKGNKK